jgi:hypothetical protein
MRIAAFLEENGTVVVVIAAFTVALAVGARNGLAADGWMALLSGREVAEHGLQTHETLTVWAHGRTWIDQQWLAQLFLYWLETLGGIRLVMLAHTFFASCGLAAAALLARRLGGSARSVTWICVVALVVYYPGAAVMRPQSFAYVLFVATLWLLVAEGRAPSRRVYALLPLLVVWANLHGSVILGAGLVTLFAAVELLRASFAAPRRLATKYLVLAVAAWASLLVSPYSTALPDYYRRILFDSGFGRLVTEWAPTTLKATTIPLYLLAIGGAWLLGRAGSRLSTFEKLVFLGAAALALEAARNMVWFALATIVILPRLLDQLRPTAEEPRRMNRMLATVMLAGVVVAGAGVATQDDSWFLTKYAPPAADAAAGAAGASGRIFANETYSDWLIWTHPELAGRVAFDSRFELLRREQLQAVADFRNRIGDWRSLLDGYRVLVLDRNDEKRLIAALRAEKRARVVHAGLDAVVLRTS